MLLVQDKAIEKEVGDLFHLPQRYKKWHILKDTLDYTIEGGVKDARVYHLDDVDKQMNEPRTKQLRSSDKR